jgi:hypothetical protein
MEKRSLSEIAREVVWPYDSELPDYLIDEALIQAGIDMTDENERQRFRSLVSANHHFHVTEDLTEYLESAREVAGPSATDAEIYAIAHGMKQNAANRIQ